MQHHCQPGRRRNRRCCRPGPARSTSCRTVRRRCTGSWRRPAAGPGSARKLRQPGSRCHPCNWQGSNPRRSNQSPASRRGCRRLARRYNRTRRSRRERQPGSRLCRSESGAACTSSFSSCAYETLPARPRAQPLRRAGRRVLAGDRCDEETGASSDRRSSDPWSVPQTCASQCVLLVALPHRIVARATKKRQAGEAGRGGWRSLTSPNVDPEPYRAAWLTLWRNAHRNLPRARHGEWCVGSHVPAWLLLLSL